MGHPSDSFEPFLPFANGNFRTPTGKAELYNEKLKAQGLDPVAEFVPPEESRHSPQAKAFPLELLARKADNFLNSTFTNLPGMQALEEAGLLEMSSVDAEKRGIRDGYCARVQPARRNAIAGESGRQSFARRSRCETELGKTYTRQSKHKRAHVRKTNRHGQLCHVLFRLG